MWVRLFTPPNTPLYTPLFGINKLGVPTARGGNWYGTTVRNYAKRLI